MPVAREGIPIIISFLGAHLVFLLAGFLAQQSSQSQWVRILLMAAAALLAVLTLFSLYFFRDPERKTPDGDNLVISPADGRVLGVEKVETTEYLDGPAEKCSIFMNVFDVHVNRAPATGVVGYCNYRPGKFFNASLDKASEGNEAMSVGIETQEHGKLLVRQIAGLIARRIVCRVKPGDSLARGERFGMIRFGSRLEVFLPPGAEWKVRSGDIVRAGETILAEYR